MKGFAVLFFLAMLVSSCSVIPVLAPPTPNFIATETQIAAKIFATLTASVPTATIAPTATKTLVPTATPDLSSLIPPKRKFNHTYTIETSYDKFKNITSTSLSPKALELNVKPNTLIMGFQYEGTQFSFPSEIYFSVGSKSKDWQFLSVKQINFLIDDKVRLSYPTTRDSDVGSGYVIEWMDTDIPTSDFLKMVNAKKVALQLGYVDAELSAAQLEALRDVASRLRP
jgi:hypothetical protein